MNIYIPPLAPETSGSTEIPPTPIGPGAWVRNPSWLAMPTVTSAEQKVVGLAAIHPNGLSMGLLCRGAYTVDWGDGTTPENFADNVAAYHIYSYADGDLAGTDAPVTLDATNDKVLRTNHGYSDGDSVALFNIVSTTGLTEGARYYVVNKTADDFQVALAAGGTPIALTTDGTATLLPYKQALVTITPQAGQNLTQAYISYRPTATEVSGFTSWLDLSVSLPNCTVSQSFRPKDYSYGTPLYLERVQLLSYGATDVNGLFASMPSLRRVVINTSAMPAVTDINMLFADCYRLTEISGFWSTASVTSFAQAFQNCYSLVDFPTMSAAAAQTMASMFVNCRSMVNMPTITAWPSGSMSTQSMFNGCVNLTEVGAITAPGCTNSTSMFNGCYRLIRTGIITVTNCQNASSMYQGCLRLEETTVVFGGYTGVNCSSLFSTCVSLKEVPTITGWDKIGNAESMFYQCRTLNTATIPAATNLTRISGMFQDCTSLSSVTFTSFGTLQSGAGVSLFSGCALLTSITFPSGFALTGSTDSMFRSCGSLTRPPMFDVTGVTVASSMFRDCTIMSSLPPYVFSGLTGSVANMFQTDYALRRVMITMSGFTNADNMFASTAVEEVGPNINFASCTSMSSTFGSAALSRLRATNIGATFSIAGANMTAAALNELYTALATVTSKTITVTNNIGTAADDPTIATAKGWTVTG